MVVDSGPRRKVGGQTAPGTAAFERIEDCIKDSTLGVSTKPGWQLGGWELSLQAEPFFVGEIGRISIAHEKEYTSPSQPSFTKHALRASFGKPRPDPKVAPQGIRAGNPCPVSAMNVGKM